MNNYRTTSVKSMNLDIIRKLIFYFLKMTGVKTVFIISIHKCCCLKIGWHYDPHSGFHWGKGLTLHKICKNTSFNWPVFSCIRTESRFCPYAGEYGSIKTRILGYFMQCKFSMKNWETVWLFLDLRRRFRMVLKFF